MTKHVIARVDRVAAKVDFFRCFPHGRIDAEWGQKISACPFDSEASARRYMREKSPFFVSVSFDDLSWNFYPVPMTMSAAEVLYKYGSVR